MSDKPEKPSIARLRTKPSDRNWAMTKMGLSAGAQFAAHSVGRLFKDDAGRADADRAFYARQAAYLADQLGELKGSVMKAGQMLSLYGQYFLPEEAVEVLAGLQDDTAPVAWDFVQPMLVAELDTDRLAELEIETRPIAAASLGQAHRAVRKSDSTELVVKIQYPGVADAIDSDVRTIARLLWMSKLVPKDLSLEPVVAEVKAMLTREVDYRHEARCTQAFAERLAQDAAYAVPTVFDAYSADHVLTTSFEPGVSVRHADVQSLDQAQRDALGEAFMRLFLRELFDWRMVQTDPHFGNYRVRDLDKPQPTLVLLDFGATRDFSSAFVAGYREIVAGAIHGDRDRVLDGAESIGLLNLGWPAATLDAFFELSQLIVEPFSIGSNRSPPDALVDAAGNYRFDTTDLPQRVTRQMSRAALSRYFRIPPREIVFLHRRMAGVFIAQTTLRARWNPREMVLEALSD